MEMALEALENRIDLLILVRQNGLIYFHESFVEGWHMSLDPLQNSPCFPGENTAVPVIPAVSQVCDGLWRIGLLYKALHTVTGQAVTPPSSLQRRVCNRIRFPDASA